MALKRASVDQSQTTTAKPQEEVKAKDTQVQEQEHQVEVQGTEPETVQEAQVETATQAQDEPEVLEGELAQDAAGEEQSQQDAGEDAAVIEPEQVQQSTSQEVATASTGGAVTHAGEAQRGAIAQYVQDMGELGFEGLTVDGMSFDRIKLSEGKFVLGSEEVELGTEFDFQLMSTRPIFIVRQFDDDNAEIYFSYDKDGLTLTDGSSAAEIREKWLEDGYGSEDAPLDIKRYLEGMAQLVNRTDEWEGHMVSLSIPPASTSRLGGACVTGKQRYGLDPSGLMLTAKVGQKITKGSISWRPWVFLVKGKLAA